MTVFEYHKLGNSEAQQKEALTYLLAQSGGLATRGVLSGLAVSQAPTADGTVRVGSGAGVVQAAVLDGASMVVNDTQSTLNIFSGNPMAGVGNPRTDIVVLDRATTSIRAIIGTPSAIPSDPTVPSSALPLAKLSHAAGATSIPSSAITDLRTFTGLNVPAPTTTRIAFPLQGDQAYRGDAAPAAWVTSADGIVRGDGDFMYTTGQASVSSRVVLAANIPASIRAATDRGVKRFITVGSLGAYYGPIRHDINPATGSWTIYRPDAGSFSWAGNDQRISLDGIWWDKS